MTMPVTKLALKEEVITKRLITAEEWKQFQESLNENHKTINEELISLYNLVEAEKLDGVSLRVSKIKVLKNITSALNATMEACSYALTHYILSESQKLIIDECMRRFEENLAWFI